MRVVLIGGSAPSTPHLLTDRRFAARPGITFVLYGRNRDRLERVRRAAALLSPSLAGAIETSIELETALDGAALVVMQARVGGLEARIHDETFPLRYGIPGDEGLGPGGLAAAWRAWPVLREVLRAITARAPHARVALLTAPLGILTRCALDDYPMVDVAGLCELPSVVLRTIAADVGEESVAYEYVGVNHLGWFTRLRTPAGRDVLPDYAATRAAASFPDAAFVRRFSAVPLPYVRLDAARADVVAEQRRAPARGAVVAAFGAAAMEAFASGNPPEIRRALAARAAPWYAEAVAPWIDAVRTGRSDRTFFLTTRNAGYLSSVDPADVLEIPHRVRSGAFVAAPSPAIVPDAVAQMIAGFARYEQLAAAAVRARDARRIADVLLAHPWVPDAATAAELARATVSM